MYVKLFTVIGTITIYTCLLYEITYLFEKLKRHCSRLEDSKRIKSISVISRMLHRYFTKVKIINSGLPNSSRELFMF